MGERIQKLLAASGHGSRREIEGWIAAGRIEVNGRTARLGDKIEPSDHVRLDGRPLRLEPPRTLPSRVLIYNKPTGELSTRRDPDGRPTVFDRLPALRRGRWVAVGRLDVNTGGLMIFTTDGALAHALMHPGSQIDREYAVRVLGEPGADALRRLREGVVLEDGPARFERVSSGGGAGLNRWYHVVLREGRKREVRRLWEAVGFKVSRLIRTRFGPVRLPRDLPRGQSRELPPGEVRALYAAAGIGEDRAAAPRGGASPTMPSSPCCVRSSARTGRRSGGLHAVSSRSWSVQCSPRTRAGRTRRAPSPPSKQQGSSRRSASCGCAPRHWSGCCARQDTSG